MTFEEFLTDYRAQGGIAENVRLGEGPYGRGLFPIDPSRQATVFTPEHLVVPLTAVELQNSKMVVKPGMVAEPAARIFESYQEHFGWSAGGRDEAWHLRTQWHELAPEIISRIESMGVLDDQGHRFLAPSDDECMVDYLRARYFGFKGQASVVPVIDLVNYSNDANSYVSEGGFGVTGTFGQEMLVRYNLSDAFALQMSYGFTALTNFAYSVAITLSLPNGLALTIGRSVEGGETRGGAVMPPIEQRGTTVHLGHLKLGNLAAPDLPRSMFRAAIGSVATAAQADELFDVIARFNRTQFIALLRTLRAYDGPMVRGLETAALNQLETLSACVGARAL